VFLLGRLCRRCRLRGLGAAGCRTRAAKLTLSGPRVQPPPHGARAASRCFVRPGWHGGGV